MKSIHLSKSSFKIFDLTCKSKRSEIFTVEEEKQGASLPGFDTIVIPESVNLKGIDALSLKLGGLQITLSNKRTYNHSHFIGIRNNLGLAENELIKVTYIVPIWNLNKFLIKLTRASLPYAKEVSFSVIGVNPNAYEEQDLVHPRNQ